MRHHRGGQHPEPLLLQAGADRGQASRLLPDNPYPAHPAMHHGLPADQVRDRPRVPVLAG